MKEHKTNKGLTAFLYLLMRDHVTPGKLEEILERHLKRGAGFTLTNGYLGEYAEELANKIEELNAISM